METAPPPPGLLMTDMGTLTSPEPCRIFWIRRAVRSTLPPGVVGALISMARVGCQPCAPAAAHVNASAQAPSNRRRAAPGAWSILEAFDDRQARLDLAAFDDLHCLV